MSTTTSTATSMTTEQITALRDMAQAAYDKTGRPRALEMVQLAEECLRLRAELARLSA